jgi:hypothetical protein
MNPKKKAYMADPNRVITGSNLLQFKDIDNARKFSVARISIMPIFIARYT